MRPFLIILALAVLCRARTVEIGTPAPPLALSQVLQAPAGTKASWESLKGNVVVLEFWATWCAGCRDQIPHLNRLQEQFRNQPVRFVSITDEEPGIVQRFVKEYPISGWIGLDPDGQTFQAYHVKGRPTAALIDQNGMLRGFGNSTDLTAEVLEDLLAGKAISYSNDSPIKTPLQAAPDPLFNAMLRPAAAVEVTGFSSGAVSGTPGKSWNTWGVPLRRLLSDAYGIPETRVIVPTLAATAHYDVALAMPNLNDAERIALLRRTIGEAFHLQAHIETRQSDVYVLERLPGIEPKLAAASATSGRWTTNGELTAVSMPLSFLAGIAERVLGKTVIDETGLSSRFDFQLKWNPAIPQSLTDSVRTQLDLQLTPARRPLNYLVVDSAVQPQPW